MSAETTTRTRSPYVLALAEVQAVERVSPNFVRVTFGGEELDEFGTPGDVFDARIKLIFPPSPEVVPPLDRDAEDWWAAFLAVAEEERGSMRTYSIRELRTDGSGTQVVVDFVLHLQPGLTGPASTWASTAEIGRRLFLIGPRRGREDRGGIEYAPGGAGSVLLAGDETAAPAIARILEDAPRDLRGGGVHRGAGACRRAADRRTCRCRGALAAARDRPVARGRAHPRRAVVPRRRVGRG